VFIATMTNTAGNCWENIYPKKNRILVPLGPLRLCVENPILKKVGIQFAYHKKYFFQKSKKILDKIFERCIK
jgi:tRNA/tmRNA/rRNA uracil-C5-methylase (TrmA/RlmC/RlmD family)